MTSRLEDRVIAAAREFRRQYADAVFDEALLRRLDQELIDSVDALDLAVKSIAVPRTLTPSTQGRTVREAMAIALEALPGPAASLDAKTVSRHLRLWIDEYAEHRGVILSDVDVDDEIRDVIAGLRRAR